MTPRSRLASRLVAVFALTLVGACATAGVDDPGELDASDVIDPPDAAEIADGSPFVDAPPGMIDAASPLIDAASPPDAEPQGGDCGSPSCAAATSLGSVSGDTGNQKLSASGFQSAWYRVRVSEDDHAIGAVAQSVVVKLTSPASAGFDVFVYLNPDAEVLECSSTFGDASSSGNVEQVRAEWGESGLFANNAEDGRDVSIEVRAVSGSCAPGQTWQLDVDGNL